MAANVDVIYVVASLNRELNLRRLERYLAVTWDSGATPVLVLNKADLCGDRMEILRNVEAVTPSVEVLLTSAATGEGIEALRPTPAAAARPSSSAHPASVSRSSSIAFWSARRKTSKGIRADDKGRHTTTVRQMLVVPGGAVIIDTPGLRELQSSEPDCAVQAAIDSGMFDRGRLASYRKLQREQTFIAGKKDERLRAEGQRKWKQIAKANPLA